MPPAVALLNYISTEKSSGILWRIFCQTGTFRGVFSPYIGIIYNAGGISAAIRELYCTFADFLQNWNFPLHYINFTDRNSEAAMGRVGERITLYFLGCRVAH